MYFQPEMSLVHCLVFGIIVSAVDPVAVLAVFEAANADMDLYYLVFGEALFNDGVTFVLFEGVKDLSKVSIDVKIPTASFLYIGLSFLTAPLAGILLGIVCGALTALLTKFTTHHSEGFQPIIIIALAFLSYFLNKSLGFSSILGLISCGVVQMRYAMPNLTTANRLTTRHIVKAVATLCEILIFVLFGSEASGIRLDKCWEFFFIAFGIITVLRFGITSLLVFFINRFRYKSINWRWQIIMFFGGLRGAFSFAMSLEYDGPFKLLHHDVILLIIIVTNLLNGIAAKPLVILLKLQSGRPIKEKTFYNISTYIAHHASIGLRNLSKNTMQDNFYMKLQRFEREYIIRLLCKNESGPNILVREFDEFEEQEALRLIENHSLVHLLQLQRQEKEQIRLVQLRTNFRRMST